jgi:flagellar biosynthesis/type III secretory pathway protein FliH
MYKLQLQPLELRTMAHDAGQPAFPFTILDAPVAAPVPQAPDRVSELEQMLAEAQDRMAVLEREAYDKAYAAGEKAGMELGRKRAEQILERMEAVLAQAGTQLDGMYRDISESIVDIAGFLAEWLVGDIVEAERTRLLSMAEQVSHTMPAASKLGLAVHPDDLGKFEKILGEAGHAWSLLADAALAPGTTRLFTNDQDILLDPKAAIADAIDRLKKELLAPDAATAAAQALE